MAKVRILGIEKVLANLTKEVKKIEGRTLAGLIQGAAIVRADMDKTPPLIPIDTGNLRGSWFTTAGYSGTTPFVTMGFSAVYALAVHEMPQYKQPKRKGSGPKFFEASLSRNKEKMLAAAAASAKIR